MGNVVDLAIRITSQATDAAKGLDDAAGNVDSFGSKMGALAGPAAIAGTAIAAFGVQAFHAASDVQQAIGASNTVFADNATQVQAWAKGAADSVGLSESAYLGLANTIGAQLGNAGLATDAAADSTNTLVGLGADLAATFGGDTASAVAALSSALKGEADPAEAYGLNLSAAAVSAQMAADGTDKLTGEALSAAKAQTIMALATEQAGDAVGSFADEADTAEGASQRASAQWENTQATLGQVLLPVITAVSGALAGLAGWMQENATVVQIVVGVIGALAIGILAVNAAIKIAALAQAAYNGVMLAWNAIMAANPIGIVIVAVVALVAVIVLLWNKCEWFRNGVMAIWEAIAAAATAAWDVIKAAVDAVVSFVVAVVKGAGDVVKGVWDAIRSAAETVWNAIKSTVSTVASAISSAIDAIAGPIGAVWDAIKSAASTAWDAISSTVSTVASAITGFVQGASDTIGAVWAAIQSAGEAVWGPISDAAHTALDWITGIVSDISGAVQGMIGWIQSAVDWVGNLFSGANNAADAVVAIPAPVAASSGFGASPSLARSGLMPHTTTSGGGSSGPTIVIQGALDPAAVARQVRDILRRDVRRGGTVVMSGAVTL